MSSKTPNEQPNATASVPKNPFGLWLGIALILFGLFAVIQGVIGLTDNKSRLITPEGSIVIEIADTQESRQQGLSGRSSLAGGEGMLFVFDQATQENCFWMKDMKFSIDMIWLNTDKKVITVTENVDPNTYPETFCPLEAAKFGLEVSSGRAKELGIAEEEVLRW